MEWYEFAVNSQAISQRYTNGPLLHNVDLMKVVLFEDGPKLALMISLASLPDKKPDEWKPQGNNAVYLRLDFESIDSLQVTRWSAINNADVKMSQTKNGWIAVNISSVSSGIEFIAHSFKIASVYCYRRDDL